MAGGKLEGWVGLTGYEDREQVLQLSLAVSLAGEGVGAPGVVVLLRPAHAEGCSQPVATVAHRLIGGELRDCRELVRGSQS